MTDDTYRALVVEEYLPGQFRRNVVNRPLSAIIKHDVTVKVSYSSLNYKDALSASGHKGITKNYPHTPGIDAAGFVAASRSRLFSEGEEVIVSGYDLGMNTDGGFGEYIDVPAEWVVPMPKGLTAREAMMYGTAGFTAALCVCELINQGVKPGKGKILVTGATGGVGSFAVAVLSKLGYEVAAATGKKESRDYLSGLGATEIIDRSELDETGGKPLLSGRWAGVVDNVGGNILSNAIRSCKREAVVCSAGNAASDRLETSVYPFILRGVKLIGIDAAEKNMDIRVKIWERLATSWSTDRLHQICHEVGLEELDAEIGRMMGGKMTGRALVRI